MRFGRSYCVAVVAFGCLLAVALVGGIGCAQAADPAPPKPAVADHAEEAPVRLANREVAVFRSTFLGVSAGERARRSERTIAEVLSRGGPGVVSARREPQGTVLLIDGALGLILTSDDADSTRGETLDTAANAARLALQQAIGETREARDHGRLLRASGACMVATMLLVLALWIVRRLRRWITVRLPRALERTASKVEVAGTPMWHYSRALALSRWLAGAAFWLMVGVIVYEWLSYVMTRFPYTRVWGEQLDGFLIGVVLQIGNGVLRALPDLVVAAVILLLARALIAAAGPVFDRAEQGRADTGWLDSDLARPTRRLFAIAVWLFAVVMAYPYFPGANSDAFKGVSVLVGLMLTLGGSSLVGQAAGGLILMYSRTLRVGEYVRIGDQEGTVFELGTFTTKIRTGMGEELTLPNSLVLGAVTRNYSRAVRGRGYIVDTTVTIGYDTPWRQVEAMLIEAAIRTPGILEDPAPRVVQTALSDFYVEYRLIAQAVPSEPRPRAEVLNALHGNVLDVFNENGVQIMSPHYMGDTAEPKIVARDAWHTPPARPAP